MAEYALAGLVVFALNLLPAFGPPTWSVLVFLMFTFDLEPVVLVPIGAVSAATGRFVLANGAFRWRTRLPERRLENVQAAGAALSARRGRALAGLALFAVSPLPSAQLFIGAGLVAAPLLPLTAAFFAGRLVSYSLYVGAATAAGATFQELAGDALGSPLGIAVQLLMLGGLVALVRVDWARFLVRDQGRMRSPYGDRPEGAPDAGASARS
jgi:membrane protein YqaA with SNARE-associated domain